MEISYLDKNLLYINKYKLNAYNLSNNDYLTTKYL